MTPNYTELWRALMPETALIVGALAALGFDLAFFKNREPVFRLRAASALAVLAVVAAIILVAYRWSEKPLVFRRAMFMLVPHLALWFSFLRPAPLFPNLDMDNFF